MKIYKTIAFTLALIVMNVGFASAATVLGKVAILASPSKPEIYPLVSGNKMTYEHKALIRINGGTLVAERGTILEAFDEGNKIIFQIEKGVINFRIQPHKTIVSFNTKDGVIFSPEIVRANESIIEGRIVVTESETILELSEGTLEALTHEGPRTIKAGETFRLAQAVIDESEGELADATDENNPSNDDMNADSTNGSSEAATIGVVGTVITAAIVGPIVAATTSDNGGGGGGDQIASPIE
ncbi:MAG: hypothetical protein HY693_00790 [Deltaproteobacteria bacterium]|nr:hypothetical protein [Deltaproteobacteria bacterium]